MATPAGNYDRINAKTKYRIQAKLWNQFMSLSSTSLTSGLSYVYCYPLGQYCFWEPYVYFLSFIIKRNTNTLFITSNFPGGGTCRNLRQTPFPSGLWCRPPSVFAPLAYKLGKQPQMQWHNMQQLEVTPPCVFAPLSFDQAILKNARTKPTLTTTVARACRNLTSSNLKQLAVH